MFGFSALNAQALNANTDAFSYELASFDPFQLNFSTPLYETNIPDVYTGMPRANIHPGIEYFPSKWNGWKYWMVYTPYPDSNYIYENPCVVVSNDGINWQAPAGLTNPVVTPSGTFYADVDLFYDRATDKLCIVWKSQVPLTNSGTTRIITSSDGVNWSGETSVLDSPLLATVSLVYDDVRGLYEMIGLDFAGGKTDPDFYSVYTSATIDGTYTYDRTLSLPVGAGEHYWNLYIKRLDDGSYVGMGQETTASLSGTGAVYWLKSSDGTNFTRQILANGEMYYRCAFTLIPDSSGEYLALMSGVDYFGDMRAAKLSPTGGLSFGGEATYLDEGFDSGSIGHGGQASPLAYTTGFSVAGSEAVTSAASSFAVWDVRSPRCTVKFNVTNTADTSEIFAVGRFIDENNYIRVGIRKDRPSPSYKSVDTWCGFYEEVVGGVVTVSDFMGGDLILYDGNDEITVDFASDYVTLWTKDITGDIPAFANPTTDTHKTSNKFGIAAFGVSGDVAFQNLNITGEPLPKILGASETTAGGEVMPTTNAIITVTIPEAINLKWGAVHQLAVTHDGGTTTLDGVTLSAPTGWETVTYSGSLPAGDSFASLAATDTTLGGGGYTMQAGDILAWETQTGLTVDVNTTPVVDPASTVSGSYKIWNEVGQTWTSVSTFTINDLGLNVGSTIPVDDRVTFQAMVGYLITQGYQGAGNETIQKWLIAEGISKKSFNEMLRDYLTGLGYNGTLPEQLRDWRNG